MIREVVPSWVREADPRLWVLVLVVVVATEVIAWGDPFMMCVGVLYLVAGSALIRGDVAVERLDELREGDVRGGEP